MEQQLRLSTLHIKLFVATANDYFIIISSINSIEYRFWQL